MKNNSWSLALLVVLAAPRLAHCQNSAPNLRRPLETTVCKILNDPSAYNNKLVKVRGYVDASSEYSLLADENCDQGAIWFAFADGTLPPQVEVLTNGKGVAGSTASKRRRTPSIPVHLVRDSNLADFAHYMNLNAKAGNCYSGPAPDLNHLSECVTYRVTATFTGRLDGVRKQIHYVYSGQTKRDQIDGKGFGHMGMFDAELIVQSVETVIAVDDADFRKQTLKPQWRAPDL